MCPTLYYIFCPHVVIFCPVRQDHISSFVLPCRIIFCSTLQDNLLSYPVQSPFVLPCSITFCPTLQDHFCPTLQCHLLSYLQDHFCPTLQDHLLSHPAGSPFVLPCRIIFVLPCRIIFCPTLYGPCFILNLDCMRGEMRGSRSRYVDVSSDDRALGRPGKKLLHRDQTGVRPKYLHIQ